MAILILAGCLLVTALAVVALAMLVAGARADRVQERLSQQQPPPPTEGVAPARRFRRSVRQRSSARR